MLQQAIIAVIAAVLIGEFIKVLVELARHEPVRVFHLGGMPSAHASAAAALCLSVYYESGWSLLLLACAVFGWVVIRDAYGVRWEVTKHSAALNKLAKTKEYEVTGHTRWQVACGVLLGLIVAFFAYRMF